VKILILRVALVLPQFEILVLIGHILRHVYLPININILIELILLFDDLLHLDSLFLEELNNALQLSFIDSNKRIDMAIKFSELHFKESVLDTFSNL